MRLNFINARFTTPDLCAPIVWKEDGKLEDLVKELGFLAWCSWCPQSTPTEKAHWLVQDLEVRVHQLADCSAEQVSHFRENLKKIHELFHRESCPVGIVDQAKVDRMHSPIALGSFTDDVLNRLQVYYGAEDLARAMIGFSASTDGLLAQGVEFGSAFLQRLEDNVIRVAAYKRKESSSVKHRRMGLEGIQQMNARDYSNPEDRILDFKQVAAVKLAYAKLSTPEQRALRDEQGRFPEGSRPAFPGPDLLPGYKVYQEVRNEMRLRVLGLSPTDEGQAPMIVCRGTAKDRYGVPYPGNVQDDVQADIGLRSLELSLDTVRTMVKELSAQYGPIILLGHSLGGAVAAQILAECHGMRIEAGPFAGQPVIKELTHFGSPGSGAVSASKYAEVENDARPVIRAYYHRQDKVWLFGDDFLQGTEKHFFGGKERVSHFVQAHSHPRLLSEYREDEDLTFIGEEFSAADVKRRQKYQGHVNTVRSYLGKHLDARLGKSADKKLRRKELEQYLLNRVAK